MSKKTLLKEIDGIVENLEELYEEADDDGHGGILDELSMEMETLNYVKIMINKHLK